MPFTPLHLGPGFLMGLLFFRYLDLPTVLVASVILDVEPVLVLSLSIDAPLHSVFHSFLGGTLAAVLLIVVMRPLRPRLSSLFSLLGLEQRPFLRTITLASLAGIYLHLLLDAVMHHDLQPFYPFALNPFFSNGAFLGVDVTTVCVGCFFGGLVLHALRGPLAARRWPVFTCGPLEIGRPYLRRGFPVDAGVSCRAPGKPVLGIGVRSLSV